MDIDVTYLIQFGLFLVCLVALNTILLKPFLKVIQEREARTVGAQEQVQLLKSIGDEDMAKYQARMREARKVAQTAREALKGEGRDAERNLLADVRADIAERLNVVRLQVGQAEAGARSQLAADTSGLARLVVHKVLGREVRP